jgi:dipeptidyl aminopeptidase/acylaminoacyl peptidase
MTSKQIAACGVWPSPIGADQVAAGASPLSQLAIDGADIYWLAGRASEAGRNTLLRLRGGALEQVTPAPFNVRSRVHEYGGGAYLAAGAIGTGATAGATAAVPTVYFSHFADNRIYTVVGDGAPVPLTAPNAQRHADFVLDRQRQRLISVREQHAEGSNAHPINTVCAIGADGSETVLVQGSDFYAAPRLSPDGRQLAWMSWDHPRMPWQGTELWLAEIEAGGALGQARLVAGGAAESICQPEWSPDGVLHFVSDRSGWWNLYRLDGDAVLPLCPMQAEFGVPHWSFGVSMYGFRSASEIVCTYIENGVSQLARLVLASGKLEPIAHPYQEIRELRVAPGFVLLLGGAPTRALELARIDLATQELAILAQSIASLPQAGYLSVPESISYPSANGRVAHAFYYRPLNARFTAAPEDKPPLIVIIHGGPTSMASNTLKLATQYWTSRGFAMLDVNYGGSSGFGRAYRDSLRGQWGIVDVEDCLVGARYLAERGQVGSGGVDPERLIIRGGSAGGYTTLCALTFHDLFKAGASYYGVSDLKGLDADSHKFESHYNDYLIAPPPASEALYLARSPIHHTDRLACPMIFFQGLDDKVVPPQQSQLMVDALKARGVPVAYLALEGEGHGFRKADNIAHTLEAERYFYLRVFGLFDRSAPDAPAPIPIDNLPELEQ